MTHVIAMCPARHSDMTDEHFHLKLSALLLTLSCRRSSLTASTTLSHLESVSERFRADIFTLHAQSEVSSAPRSTKMTRQTSPRVRQIAMTFGQIVEVECSSGEALGRQDAYSRDYMYETLSPTRGCHHNRHGVETYYRRNRYRTGSLWPSTHFKRISA